MHNIFYICNNFAKQAKIRIFNKYILKNSNILFYNDKVKTVK